ncbi:unnamed protein product, partial [Penicillium pancosmium]
SLTPLSPPSPKPRLAPSYAEIQATLGLPNVDSPCLSPYGLNNLALVNHTFSRQHHGFLWISGKAGTGKSTIMKFAYDSMKRANQRKGPLTASFFFHARGEYLERSIIGMYRSLLLQLLEGYPDLQTILNDSTIVWEKGTCPSLNILKNLFRDAVAALGQRSFTCFVDALDECDEQQVVDMVRYFEDMADQCTADKIIFRICFSSRHYPYISIKQGVRLTLEDQSGHAEDLEMYVSSHLHFKNTELQSQLLDKAAGVFMWVVLVVDILNKEYRRGGMALRKRLNELPSGLSQLFKDILKRDDENMEALLLCILWILFAKRPLQPREFYHALWSGLSLKDLADGQIPLVDTTVLENGDSDGLFARYVTSSSKGLAEITKSTKQPKVQFIHESVRDFLIKDNGIRELWPDLGIDCQSTSHEMLKHCSNHYLKHFSEHELLRTVLTETRSNKQEEIIYKKYSFLDYASSCVLYHADTAAKVIDQQEFLSSFRVPQWINVNNLFEKYKIRRYTSDATFLYILADKGFSELIRSRVRHDPDIHILAPGERYQYPLFAALANGNKDTVAALLNLSSSVLDGIDIAEGLDFKKDFKGHKGRTPLSWAAQSGRAGLVRLLLQTRTDIHQIDKGGRTSLSRAVENGHESIANYLILKGADVNIPDRNGQLPLHQACWNGHETIARLLIDNGSHINACDEESQTPLHQACWNGHETIARLLLDKGAESLNNGDQDGHTPLHQAAWNGHKTIACLLLRKGADISVIDNEGQTALHQASRNGHGDLMSLLVDQGAEIINIADKDGHTSLHQASANGHRAAANILVDKGAEINAIDKEGQTALYLASMKGHKPLVQLLIEKGADINISNKKGWTALHQASQNGRKAIVKLLIDKEIQIGQGKRK